MELKTPFGIVIWDGKSLLFDEIKKQTGIFKEEDLIKLDNFVSGFWEAAEFGGSI